MSGEEFLACLFFDTLSMTINTAYYSTMELTVQSSKDELNEVMQTFYDVISPLRLNPMKPDNISSQAKNA